MGCDKGRGRKRGKRGCDHKSNCTPKAVSCDGKVLEKPKERLGDTINRRVYWDLMHR